MSGVGRCHRGLGVRWCPGRWFGLERGVDYRRGVSGVRLPSGSLAVSVVVGLVEAGLEARLLWRLIEVIAGLWATIVLLLVVLVRSGRCELLLSRLLLAGLGRCVNLVPEVYDDFLSV